MKKRKDKQRQEMKAARPDQKAAPLLERLVSSFQIERLAGQDWLAAALVAAGFLTLYALTLCPTIFAGDSGEFSAIAACWGIAHPPGYPLYSLLGGLFIRLLPVGEIAWRTNLFSALCGSLAVGLLFLLCRRIGSSLPAAAAAAICFGTGALFWSQSVVAEVYCFDLLLIVLAVFFVLRLQERTTRTNYFVCGLIAGLMLGNRIVNLVYFIPVLVVFMAAARKRSGQPLSVFFYALAGLAVSGAVFLYLPIASSFNPPIDAGDPETFDRFWAVITARTYQDFFGALPLATELRRVGGFVAMLPANLGVAALAAPVGCWLLYRRGAWLLATGLSYAAVSCVGFAIQYSIPDISVYFLPALAMLGLLAACGFDLLPRRFVWLAVALALVNLPLEYRGNDLSRARLAEQYGKDILAAAPPGAIIFTSGDTNNNVLVYLQSIQGLRPDVSIILATPFPPENWYAALQRRKYPHVVFPSHGSDYYLQEQQIRSGDTWVKALLQSNLQNCSVCMLEQPEILLRNLKLTQFLPNWHKVPDGVLYCLDSAAEPGNLDERIAATKAFWDQHAEPAAGSLTGGAHMELAPVAFNYIKARYFFAEALAMLGKTQAAVEQLRAVAAANPDQLEEKIYGTSHGAGMFRLGQRAQKALESQPGN